jgi:hypothetical protein
MYIRVLLLRGFRNLPARTLFNKTVYGYWSCFVGSVFSNRVFFHVLSILGFDLEVLRA